MRSPPGKQRGFGGVQALNKIYGCRQVSVSRKKSKSWGPDGGLPASKSSVYGRAAASKASKHASKQQVCVVGGMVGPLASKQQVFPKKKKTMVAAKAKPLNDM